MAGDGKRVRGSRTGRPIMALLDLLGRRWTLRIVWELRGGEPMTSRRLREMCDDISPTVLQARLTELRAAGFVALERPAGYRLTPLGRQLLSDLLPLHQLADRWAQQRKAERPPG